MRNRTILLLAGLLLLSFAVTRGKGWKASWEETELEKAHTARDIPYMDEQEQEVVQLLNLARLFPQLYAKRVLQPFLDTTQRLGSTDRAVQTLQQDLSRLKPMPPLHPSRSLTETADEWAGKAGKEGLRGHGDIQGRMGHLVKVYEGVSENCSYGYRKPVTIVNMLLVDKGQAGQGHRKAILKREHAFVGVAIGEHRTQKFICVQDFGGQKIK